MRELGYVEGKNLIVEWRFADGKAELLPDMAEDLVRLKVDVIVAAMSPAIGAAKKAIGAIPIVMANTGDPVASGFVKSLARPEGNITGLSNMGGDTGPKLLDLLLTVMPTLSRVAMLVTSTSTTYRAISESVQGAGQKVGVKTLVIEASSPQEIENAFSMMLQGVEAGGLMSYGGVRSNNYLRSAAYVDKILCKTERSAGGATGYARARDQSKTAKALGLTIPQSLLLRADEVIQ
jgi:putative ABC transport system substrate-binding protein